MDPILCALQTLIQTINAAILFFIYKQTSNLNRKNTRLD